MKWLIWVVGLWLALLMAGVALAVVKGGPRPRTPCMATRQASSPRTGR